MKRAILLPGQGAQFSGMGQAWAEAFPSAKARFDRADETLGFSLSSACWNEGDAVHRTDIAQPGIFVTSVAILSVLEEKGFRRSEATLAAGLSLGEYTALWCAGSLGFEDAVRLVRLRGEAMQDASEAIPSSMTSLRATEEQARTLAKIGSEHGICSVANLNAPGQVVVSGELAALDVVEAKAKEHGVRRATRLTVAGGFHSECMRPAAERLERALAEITVKPPRVPFLSNVTGAPEDDPDTIKANLAQQVCAPVLWEKSMRWAVAEKGQTAFLEPGPGKVLTALVRKIAQTESVEVDGLSVETPEDLESLE